MPKAERERIEHEEEIHGYLKQSHISDQNVRRLRTLVETGQPHIRELAAIVLEVAGVKPYKKRRLKVLAQQRPDLLEALDRTGLIMAHHWG
jgi:hypothetical protein